MPSAAAPPRGRKFRWQTRTMHPDGGALHELHIDLNELAARIG
jgi:hypothetical protein